MGPEGGDDLSNVTQLTDVMASFLIPSLQFFLQDIYTVAHFTYLPTNLLTHLSIYPSAHLHTHPLIHPLTHLLFAEHLICAEMKKKKK